MPELHQLRQLLAVAECGTLSAAAEALHISQPALTRSVQKLEEEFGVALFDRTRNRITLNEAGRLAVEQAKRVSDAADIMTERMAAYARSLHTITVGSCAPAPAWVVTPALSALHPDMTITSEMEDAETLLNGLRADRYQLAVLDSPTAEDGILCRELVTEQLYVSLPPAHPLAKKTDGIYLSEMAGQTMLIFSDLGIWNRLKDSKMANIRFIVQTRMDAFYNLIQASVLPNFVSSLTVRMRTPPIARVNIPLLDEEAAITFWLCAAKKHKRLWENVPPMEYRKSEKRFSPGGDAATNIL